MQSSHYLQYRVNSETYMYQCWRADDNLTMFTTLSSPHKFSVGKKTSIGNEVIIIGISYYWFIQICVCFFFLFSLFFIFFLFAPSFHILFATVGYVDSAIYCQST